ncbi:MAG: aminopeptidase P family protein [Bacteroidales bacterium]|nr:aminopeptidase P family protein [Bacteroidales bacterium]MCF8343016.1 aminopeptidase P family protein [Bacteroidales bacterium]MCF8350256.1 aminopeptidase P family protein [Bacteroidales bacterium]MCF8375988.1 aminopeptidase P family protein [Bacteroidales bacterium]MCF8400476.1 aminopeptidase P family protein [Bacteroidales bacterium]
MFPKEVYTDRRNRLRDEMGSGLALFIGNNEAPMNYPANGYHFRQDSSYLYFFGLDHDNLAGVIDIDNDMDIIFGNDVSLDDIIWMGPQPTMKERAEKVGVEHTLPMDKLAEFLNKEIGKGRKVHFLPPYRGEHFLQLKQLLGLNTDRVKDYISVELIKAVVKLRSIKDKYEIEEIEKAVDIAWEMHTTAMKMAKPGVVEREIAGTIEGISLAKGGPVSFPIILSIHGETLHNHYHGNTLAEGRMMVTDAGAETPMHYASDITRTTPVGGKFSRRQKEIYEIVLKANMECIEACKPGIKFRDVHLQAANILASGLRDLGIMKGDVAEAVRQGAHALFMPHGLGHMMGLDVHDMEGLGEDYVGYDEETKRSDQFGTAFLRLSRELQSGFVLTVEPGCYFIPALIDLWKKEGRFTEFINYDKAEEYKDFGGIRIEDDVLITDTGYRVLGKPIPKTVAEIEETCKG